VVVVPQLSGDEHLVTVQTAVAQPLAHVCLVAVDGGGVDMPVADVQRGGNGLLGNAAGGAAEDTEAQDRDPHLAAQRQDVSGTGRGAVRFWGRAHDAGRPAVMVRITARTPVRGDHELAAYSTCSIRMGSWCCRCPVAWKTALAMAGATPIIETSAMPFTPRSLKTRSGSPMNSKSI
jgi:hypothetical protein